MSFAILRKVGVAELLQNAAQILQQRGHTKGITHNFKTGEVDVLGAIFLAAGAKEKHLKNDSAEECKVPEIKQLVVHESIQVIEAQTDQDISAWNDSTDLKQIVRTLRSIADQILIATN